MIRETIRPIAEPAGQPEARAFIHASPAQERSGNEIAFMASALFAAGAASFMALMGSSKIAEPIAAGQVLKPAPPLQAAPDPQSIPTLSMPQMTPVPAAAPAASSPLPLPIAGASTAPAMPIRTAEPAQAGITTQPPSPKPQLQLIDLSGFARSGPETGRLRPLHFNEGKEVWMTNYRPLQGNAPTDWRWINTDFSRILDQECGKKYRCERNVKGQPVYIDPNGTRITHFYDQSRPVDQRNTEIYELPNGSRQIVTHCPLVLDLKNSGIWTSSRWTRFDIDGRGLLAQVSEIDPGAGVLVFDSDGNGIAGENGRELFGDATDLDGRGRPDGYRDGFEALAALIRKAERQGVVPSGTLESGKLGPKELSRLHRAYGLGIRVGGLRARTISLEQAGVREIFLPRGPSQRIYNFDGRGNDRVRREGAFFVRVDGSKGSYQDIFFSYEKPALRRLSLFEGIAR